MLGKGFRIGRLYGINIRVDWSWLIIVLLITWNLNMVFGQVHPDWGPGMRWGLALVAALLFFASVLAHELAHSVVARAQGIPVRNITLFLFGGVANIQREPTSPKNEFLMAAAGPFTSFIIGMVLLLVTAGSVTAGGGVSNPGQLIINLSPASTILLWLGSINIILAVFNLIPGFPLDGGRVLRSILWAVTNNLRQATRWAAYVGQGIAWIMIVAGIAMAFGMRIPLLGTGLINGIWLAFIGWFLNGASAQSYQQVAIQDVLEGVPVSRLMRRNPPTVEPNCAVADLVHTHLMDSDDQAFPVIEDGHLVGIVTLDDVRRAPRNEWEKTYVRDLMTPRSRLVTVSPDEDASVAMEKLIQRDIRQIPVVGAANGMGDAELQGLLRRRDIMRWLQMNNERSGQNRDAI